MNYLDLFSGIGGFHLGLERAGFKFNWTGHSEIDKHAESVYQKHFPGSEDLGDVKRIRASRLPRGKYIVTAGWPCQDNSIAGKRKGQSGGLRSGLFNQVIRILSELLAVGSEVIFIGENVKGLYSVSWNVDFFNTITRLTDLDTGMPQLTLESQLLNTRWFLPQNRERIYFVGYSGKGSGFKVFPIGEGNSNNEQTQRKFEDGVLCQALDSSYHKGPDGKRTMIMCDSGQGRKTQIRDNVAPLRANTGAGHNNLLRIGNIDGKDHMQNRVYSPEGCAAALKSSDGLASATGLYEVRAVMDPARHNKSQHGRITKGPGEPMFTLTGQDKHGVEIQKSYIKQRGRGYNPGGPKDICPPITSSRFEQNNHVSGIRRLTPVECARLQGFPDNWCSDLSDTQAYKCYGNSVSVPVVEEIGKRLMEVCN